MQHSILKARTISLYALALAGAMVWFGCSKQQAGGGFEMPPTPVEIADVQTVTVTDKFEAVGTIEGAEAVTIVSEVSALVMDMPFAEGQEIDSGGLKNLYKCLGDPLIPVIVGTGTAYPEEHFRRLSACGHFG